MKFYSAKGNGELELTEIDSSQPSELIKLKVCSVLPTQSDINAYMGKLNLSYPIVPCCYITAVVSEDREEYGLKRGAKVIVNPYILSSANGGYAKVKSYGTDEDGFLRDFVALPMDNIIPFPEEVKEDEAIFTGMVAVALAVINSFDLTKGEYIALVGGSMLTNIIGQLALYYQAIPIFVSSDPRQIAMAEKSGIYYTVDEAKEDTYERVMSITGGRMAEHTVLHAKHGVTPNFLHTLTARGGDCIVASMNSYVPRLEADIGLIAQKQLKLKGVSCGVEEVNSAVNMLAQKQLKLAHFIDKRVGFGEVPELFEEMSKDELRYICPIIKV